MRVAALVAVVTGLSIPTVSYATVYDFTVELPASPGSQGRGVAPQQRLTFSLDTTQAQFIPPAQFSPSYTFFSTFPLTIFTYATNATSLSNSSLDVTSGGFGFHDPSSTYVYLLDSGTFSRPSTTPLSFGQGTAISFPVGVSLPVTNESNTLYLRQDGTLFATLDVATSVSEPSGWAVLCTALLMIAVWQWLQPQAPGSAS